MLSLDFEQVHWKAVARTILMGRNRALSDREPVVRAQEIAIRSTVVDDTMRFSTGKGHAIFAHGRLAKSHSGMVLITKRVNMACESWGRHEETSSKYLKRGVGQYLRRGSDKDLRKPTSGTITVRNAGVNGEIPESGKRICGLHSQGEKVD